MLKLLSAYQFVSLNQLPLLRERILVKARELGLRGTVLIADEGINFSLGGEEDALQTWLKWAEERLNLNAPIVNWQSVSQVPFLRLKVRIRPEVITFDKDLKPGLEPTGEALAPERWHELIAREDVQLVDTRNQYEYELGTFDRAVDPATVRFTDFGAWALENLVPEQPVAMFCTGGVRCEKASAWLLKHGFTEVYQLEGGILNYLRTIPEQESRWSGECFVFDDRVSLDHGLKPTGRPICAGCRRPVEGLEADAMPPVDEGGRCRLCPEVFDKARLAGLKERVRQIALAQDRGDHHLGPQIEESDA